MFGAITKSEANAMLNNARTYSPQLTFVEFAAWFHAVSVVCASSINGVSLAEWNVTKFYIRNVANAAKRFAVPVYRYINDSNADNSWGASLSRYFRYVFIDATTTSGIAPALYTASLSRTTATHSRFNLFYPILVSLLGTPLKVLLEVAALAYLFVILPLMIASMAIVAPIFYALGRVNDYKEILDNLLGTFPSAFGIILTALISNINPIFLLKTILIDPVLCLRTINQINTVVNTEPELLRRVSSVRTPSPLRSVRHISNATLTYKPTPSEIVATLNLSDGIRSSVVINAVKELGSGYVFKLQNTLWDPLKATSRDLVFKVFNADETNNMGSIRIKIGSVNTLTLKFTETVDPHDQICIAIVFTKIVKSIAVAVNTATPMLDISACPSVTEDIITSNIRGLNTGATTDIVFIDRKTSISSNTPETTRYKPTAQELVLV